ncbi:MAG: hypothetical protein Q9213_000695 [Squamulea squamosa]
MSESEASTEPATPKEGSAEVIKLDESNVFAWLRPLSKTSCQAFDATVNLVIKKPAEFTHVRQFLHCDSRQDRAQSVFTDDEDDSTDRWCIGSGRARSKEVDLLLAPPTDRWMKIEVAGIHATLAIHPESCRISLQARHTVTISKNSTKTFRQQESYILEHDEIILIGDCAYTFQYTDYFFSPAFERDIIRYMRSHIKSLWTMNEFISPNSVGPPRLLGNYYCSPSAFAQGTFGKVSAGWTENGATIAIKTFKNPKESEIKSYIEIMEYIGTHENIVQLLKCISYFENAIPEAFCVYKPLAVASLTDIIDAYVLDSTAMLALCVDYLNGLTYLHDQKGIMHRDINPNNLAITSFHNHKGFIIDLDSATTSPTSTDHMKGTIPYLAPEIMSLKRYKQGEKQPPPYGKSADIWALGLAMYALYTGRQVRWMHFASRGAPPVSHVTEDAHRNFRVKLRQDQRNAKGAEAREFLISIERMNSYKAENRMSASETYANVLQAWTNHNRGTIVSKRKRQWEE